MTSLQPSLVQRIDQVGQAMPRTTLLQLPDDTVELFAKLEYENPFGSSKDRSCLGILRGAASRAEIDDRSTIVESSSGNFAIALASFCRYLSLSFIPILDPNCNTMTRAQLQLLCDRVEQVEERDATGGFLLTRLDRVKALCEELDNTYWPNQYGNPDAALAHYALTGAELCTELPQLDYLFVGVSTGGTIAGLSQRVREDSPHTRVIAVDVEGSAVFGGPATTRHLPGLGSSLKSEFVAGAVIDDVVTVSEQNTVAGCRLLLRKHGLYAGGSTGTVYYAIQHYFKGHTGPPPRVAFLCVDRGNAYAETIFNDAWVRTVLG